MELKFTKSKIEFEKELNALDKLVIDFTSALNKLKIKYVVVSGYVSILFGRSRSSEDIDIIVEKIGQKKFEKLWLELYGRFECLNTKNTEDAYAGYLLTNHPIRFSKKDKPIPNIEMKFPRKELDLWTLKERKEVRLNHYKIFISPLELQIPFKLYLGSEKDIEDARHLYRIFKDRLNLQLLDEFNQKLKVNRLFNKYLRRR